MADASAIESPVRPSAWVIVVTGGIAAIKTASLVSRLVQRGEEVRVVMTDAATRFVGPASFTALTGHPTAVSLWDQAAYPLGAHIELARVAKGLVVAPASADFLAKAAHGLADDLASTLYLAHRGPVWMAPAMNAAMWEHVAVQRNVATLRADGVRFLDPSEGWLSCRDRGTGRMAEPDVIIQTLAESGAIAVLDRPPESESTT